MNSRLKQYSILTSYLIGVPVGLFTIFIILIVPVIITGEGLATIAIAGVYGKAILGLIISFLIALWIGGANAFSDISKNKSLLFTSFKYALTVNAIIWTTFILITLISNIRDGNVGLIPIFLIIPILLFIFCVALTTFTLALLICSIIKKKIKRETLNMKSGS